MELSCPKCNSTLEQDGQDGYICSECGSTFTGLLQHDYKEAFRYLYDYQLAAREDFFEGEEFVTCKSCQCESSWNKSYENFRYRYELNEFKLAVIFECVECGTQQYIETFDIYGEEYADWVTER